MYERICSINIMALVASIVLIVSSIGCCSRQHVDINSPPQSKHCEIFERIDMSIEALDRTIQSNNETMKTLDKVVKSNNETINTIRDFIKELMEKDEEINVYPTSLTLKLSDKDNKENNCFTVATGRPIDDAFPSNNIVKVTEIDKENGKIFVEGVRVGNAVITIVSKLGKTRDVKVKVIDPSLKVIKIAGEWIGEDKTAILEKWEKKKILIKSDSKPSIRDESEVNKYLQKIVFRKINESENMWESTIMPNESLKETKKLEITFWDEFNNVEDTIFVKVKQ